MNIFQEGAYHKNVSLADLELSLSMFNAESNAVLSSSAIDRNRKDIQKIRRSIDRLKRELESLLRDQHIPTAAIEFLRSVINDDVVPSDTVGDTSDKTDYVSVRYQKIPNSNMNEFNELFSKNCGRSLDRISGILQRLKSLRMDIAKLESDSKNKTAARKEFEDKRTADPESFNRYRKQLLALSEMMGYANALAALANDYPYGSVADQTIKATSEQFDRMCWKWRQYSRKLYQSIDQYMDDFVDVLSEPMSPNVYFEALLAKSDITPEDIARVAIGKVPLVYNKATNQFQIKGKTEQELVESLKMMLDNEALHPHHYTGVAGARTDILRALSAFLVFLELMWRDVESKLQTWSGGKATVTSNPAVERVVSKAKAMIMSPVKATVSDTTSRLAFVAKSVQRYKAVSDKISSIKQFLERPAEEIRRALFGGKEPCDREFLRKVLSRKSMPVKGNLDKAKPNEDAARERVRKKYGPNVPFEDEVNIGTDDKPIFVKESTAQKDPITGSWRLKSDVASDSLKSVVDSTDVNSSG